MINFKPYIIFISILLILLSACKERNDMYPPAPWAEYFYEIPARPVSAILESDVHYTWFGSQDNKGLLLNDGYGWKQFNLATTGISFDSVTAIVKDGNGLTWVAWKSGLANYDGTSWKSVSEFEGKRVTSVAIQGIGIIWVGVDGNEQYGGLAKYTDGTWTFYNKLTSELPSSHIRSLVFDHDQQLWIGTSDIGVIKYNGHSWMEYSAAWFWTDPGTINTLAIDPDGIVWAGTSTSRLLKMSNSNASFLNTGTSMPINSIIATTDGSVWIGTAGAGILNYSEGKWRSYNTSNSGLPVDYVLTMGINNDGKILGSLSDGHVIYFK